MQIIDHIGITVKDIARAKKFYDAALAPLGIVAIMEFDSYVGYGRGNKPEFWISGARMDFVSAEQIRAITPIHICLKAHSQKEVDDFYAAALTAGAKDHGKPGLRKEYHPHYYGAFVLDLEGNNLEAVFHG